MLLNITPSGNEFQRKMLLEHSSKIRTIFLLSLLLIPLAIFVGNYFAAPGTVPNNDYMKNVAMIVVDTNGKNDSQGTAFLVSDSNNSGYLLTARHVIADTQSSKVALMFPEITNDAGEPLITTASIVWTTEVPFDGRDIQTLRFDAALLKLEDPSVLPEDVMGFSLGTDIAVKQKISIYGFPSHQGYARDGQIANTAFDGIEDLFTLSFQIDDGESGAPIYDEETGDAVGIAIASATHTDLQNICISIKRVLELMDQAGVRGLLTE